MLYVEVTESAFVREGDVIRKEIERFRSAGYEVWMDDFGSGYSSLNTLKDYNFDEIKIDMAFLSSSSEKSRNIIKAIIRMAKEIGIHTLVEGVETEDQVRFIRSIGCELIQGYYYGKPMTLDELKETQKKKGWIVETPDLRQYYGSLKKVDFLTDKSMAVVEYTGTTLHYLFANREFMKSLHSAGVESLEKSESSINGSAGPIGKNIRSFIESLAQSAADRTMTYTENGQYMKLEVRHLAQEGNTHLGLAFLTNITINEKENEALSLDWVMRNIFYLYQAVGLVDPEGNAVIPLVNNSPYQTYFHRRHAGLAEMAKQYASVMVHPDDRQRFLEFCNLSNIRQRIHEDSYGTVVGCFRTLGNDRQYHWNVHSILPVQRKGKTYLLYTVRNSPLDEKSFRKPLLKLLNRLPFEK